MLSGLTGVKSPCGSGAFGGGLPAQAETVKTSRAAIDIFFILIYSFGLF
jgi:hypothetical protein